MPRAETRYFNMTNVVGGSQAAAWTSMFVAPRIAAGNTATTRTGEWITVTSLKLNMQWTFKGTEQQIRIIGVIVRDGNVSFPPTIALQDKLKSDPAWDRKDWVRILFDKIVYPSAGVLLPDAASTSQGVVVKRRVFLRMRQPIHFTGSASTDEGRNFIQIFQIGTATATADTLDFDHDGWITWRNQV